MKCDMDVLEFMDHIEKAQIGEKKEFTKNELDEINRLRDSKFATWEWIWGRSKEYSLNTHERFDYGSVEVHVNTDHGVIRDISFTGDFFGVGDIHELETILVGTRYEYKDITEKLKSFDIQKYIFGSNSEDISKLLFKNSLL